MRQFWKVCAVAAGMAVVGVCRAAPDDYMVVDLSKGVAGPYTISYTNAPPEGGWTDAHKTSLLVLRRIPRATFIMGSPTNETGRIADGREDQREVTISNDYYVGVFEITEGQCKRLLNVGSADSVLPAEFDEDVLRIDAVLNKLKGTHTNDFAIPNEAQWEYACRAGSAEAYCFGSEVGLLPAYAWYQANAGGNKQRVGLKTPNAFGLYDMHGNMDEVVERLGGGGRWLCGGRYSRSAERCRSAERYNYSTVSMGLRLCLEIPTPYYRVTVTNGSAGVSSGTNGQVVAIWANPPPALNVFDRWTGDTQTVANVTASNTTVRIPGTNIALTATYRLAPFWLTVENGNGTNRWQLDRGDVKEVAADAPAPGKRFSHWAVYAADPRLGDGFNPLSPVTTLVMPSSDVTLSAIYEDIPTYRLTVVNGFVQGGGTAFTNGALVTIFAAAPPEHHTFLWTGNTATVADTSYWVTTLVMPASDVTLTATYPPVRYTLTVNGGIGGGAYTNGQVVAVAATNHPSAWHVFNGWIGDTNRLADVGAATTTVVVAGAATLTPTYLPLRVPANNYLIVNLTAARPDEALSFLETPPEGGWTEVYLTDRLVLREVQAGTFEMGSPAGETDRADEPRHTVTLTRPYYLGLFEVTQAQWNRVAGTWPSFYNQADRARHPVEQVSYADIRGMRAGYGWPPSSAVDGDSFMGRLRAFTGDATFDLPTEAQWEYACRAGTTGQYAGSVLSNLAFYAANSEGHTWTVGQKNPNAWGFYDMHGNVAEFCLDWYSGEYAVTNQFDPQGPLGGPWTRRITRGGGWTSDAESCRSAARGNLPVTNLSYMTGLRLARPVADAYRLTVVNGLVTTGGSYVAGTKIGISARRSDGWTFASWQVTPAGASLGAAFRTHACDTLLVMPTQAVTVAATYTPDRPLTVTLDAAGGAVAPAVLVVSRSGAYGGPFGAALPVPSRFGYAFLGWRTAPDGAGSEVTGETLVEAEADHTLFAQWAPLANVPPVFTRRSPAAAVVAMNENAALSLSVSATDAADPEASQRGMSNITWIVDGATGLVTRTGAPGTISSTLSYRPNSATVVDAASRDVLIEAVALDRGGASVATGWVVRVANVRASQSITFGALPILALNAPDFEPGATSSSGLPVTYASSDESVARIVDGKIRVVGAGSATITASQPGNFDFLPAADVRRTLTVKVSLTVDIPSGGGTVSGAGLYQAGAKVNLTAKPAAGFTFLRWEDGGQVASRTLVMPQTNVVLAAWFGLTAEIPPPEVADPGEREAMVGVYYCLPLEVRSESLPRVTVSNLPAGLSHNVAANKIEGVPKAAVTNRLVTVRAANVNKTVVTNTFVMNVLPLPAWAQGGFSGSCLLRDGAVPGMAEMTVSAQGAISGKLSAGGTNYTFKAGSYTNGGDFAFETVAVAGKAKIPLVVTVTHPEVYTGGPASLGAAEGWLDGAEEVNVALWRNVWKDADMAGALTNYAGYYTATLPGGGETGSGYLLLTLDAMGGVKVAGKLADGTSVSLSRTLILDPAGRLFVFCHTAPSGYKGGGFWAPVEIVRPQEGPNVLRVLEGNECRWESLDPLATDDYAAGGFSRKPGLTGGWYDKLGNLYDYYADRALEVGTAGGPGTPELILNGERVEAAWWDPAGIALTPVTNRYGVMTGLAAPKATSPVKIEGVYDYDETTNTVGLTVSLTRATGVFKGKFKVWFDAGTTHTYKQVAYEGALTPVRADPEDGIEGRGFFLWPDKAAYLNAQNKLVSYGFNWSYDFLILLQ